MNIARIFKYMSSRLLEDGSYPREIQKSAIKHLDALDRCLWIDGVVYELTGKNAFNNRNADIRVAVNGKILEVTFDPEDKGWPLNGFAFTMLSETATYSEMVKLVEAGIINYMGHEQRVISFWTKDVQYKNVKF